MTEAAASDECEARIERGDLICMSFGAGGRQWWFSDAAGLIRADRIERLGNRLVENGDSLFGWRGNSQTWRIVRDE